MDRPDIQIARKILGVLHDVDELAFNHPAVTMVQDEIGFKGYALCEYDLNKSPLVHIPESVEYMSEMIEEHIRSSTSTDPWGMVNNELVILKLSDQSQSSSGRLFLLHMDYITAFLDKLFPYAHITPAERKALLQSLSGISLKDAASLDSVSYETKKTQLKSVFQKTQLPKQQTLSNFLITHLTLDIATQSTKRSVNAESDEMFFHYVDTYMGSYVRASVVQESARNRFRVIEIGDPAGMPVVCIHHLGIINFSEEEISEIYRQRLRLICPLRHGALGPGDPKVTSANHMEHAISGIDLAVSLTGQRESIVVSMLSGCLYAINYLEKYQDKVSKLIMLGASYKPPAELNSTSRFKKNLHELAVERERTLELTVSTLLESIDQPEALKKVMKESTNNCDADNETIEDLFADENQVHAMRYRLRHSPLSIVEDLKIQAHIGWAPLQSVKTKVHFIHGSEDELIPVENIRQLVDKKEGTKLHIVEGAGNWIFGKYTSQTMSIIRDVIDDRV